MERKKLWHCGKDLLVDEMYMHRDVIGSCVQEESADGLERESISACNDDKPDVWAFCLFLLWIEIFLEILIDFLYVYFLQI